MVIEIVDFATENGDLKNKLAIFNYQRVWVTKLYGYTHFFAEFLAMKK